MVKSGNFFQIQVNHELRFLGRIVTWLKRSYEEIHSNQKEFLWMVTFGKTGVTRKTEVQYACDSPGGYMRIQNVIREV